MTNPGTKLFLLFIATEMGEGPSEEGGPLHKEPGKKWHEEFRVKKYSSCSVRNMIYTNIGLQISCFEILLH